MSTSQSKKVALVTGGNRGIGFAISKQLALQGISVIIGSRDIRQGEAAAKSIAPSPTQGASTTTTTTTTTTTVSAFELDVTDQDSVDKLTSTIHSKFGKLDILVNNAGVLLDETNNLPSKTDLEIVKATLETNLIGVWRLCQSFVPMMKKNKYGRIVNVSSGAGALDTIQQGLYAPAYSLSKSSLNVLTIMFANELRREAANILVNAVDPGWVRTDMGGPTASRSAEEGADTAVWLATLPDRGPTGGFFYDRKMIEW
ncbi:MAG: SDR family oxidoreductase [Thermoproteota archaeon]|nr:SDR family oxidoreductase [Thermoproteota archaeon]